MPTLHANLRRTVFSTELGWMALVGQGDSLRRLVFACSSAADAERALGAPWLERSHSADWNGRLRSLLQRYAAGQHVEFDAIQVQWDRLTDFGRRVFFALRRVRYGQTTTYGFLAAEAGSPNAARAVGNWMAANPVPLVVPCHRVVCSLKTIGNYSAPGGTAMKRRLLEMER